MLDDSYQRPEPKRRYNMQVKILSRNKGKAKCMESPMNRILTLQIEIYDNDYAAWIWDNIHCKNRNLGIIVQAVQEGPIPEEEIDNDKE
jgi:hypothetical protein